MAPQKPNSEKHKMDLERKVRKVRKAIITASYNDCGPNVDEGVMETAKLEKEAGNRFINHLILRNKDHAQDRLKFNFLLPPGIPTIAYSLMNVHKSDLQEIVVVGNSDTGVIVKEFNRTYRTNGKIKFNHEGKDWSLSNTLRKGRESLGGEDEMLLFLPGDLPLVFNINNKINDSDVSAINKYGKMYDAIFDLNSKWKVGKHFPRNYHIKVKYKGISYWVKEPNLFLLDLGKISPKLIDSIYGGRKTYMEGGGRLKTLKNLLFKDGKLWEKTAWKTIKALGLEDIPSGISAIPAANNYLGYGPWYIKWPSKLILGPPSGIINLLSEGVFSIRGKTLERLSQHVHNINSRIKVENNDPGTIKDMDSLEDWAYLTQMLNKSGTEIYPYFNELNKFRREAMPLLQEKIEMYKNWPEYMNELFKKYDLNPPYINGKFKMPFNGKTVSRMIKRNLKEQKKYLKSWRRGRKD